MLVSPIAPSSLLEADTSQKYWLLRGQAKFWSDSLFIDCLIVFFILAYYISLARCFTRLMIMITSVEQQMVALMSWVALWVFYLSMLSLSSFMSHYDVKEGFRTWPISLISLMTDRTRLIRIAEADTHLSFLEYLGALLVTTACIFVSSYVVFSVMVSVLYDGYRSMLVQMKEEKSVFQFSLDFLCCC